MLHVLYWPDHRDFLLLSKQLSWHTLGIIYACAQVIIESPVNSMKKFELDTPPPFLQGVYVRADFEFDRCGSALRQDVSDPTPEAQPLPPEEPQLSAMMSDDDFLSSLLSPQPSEPTWAEPEDATADSIDDSLDAVEDDNEGIGTLTPEQQKLPRRDRFPFNFSWIDGVDVGPAEKGKQPVHHRHAFSHFDDIYRSNGHQF